MARKTAARKPKRAATTTRRRTSVSRRKKSDKLTNFFVPLFLIVCIVFCLGLLTFIGFRTVAASKFFEVGKIETVGLKNISKESAEAVVRKASAGRGLFESDLEGIKEEISKMPYVKNVSVSRIMPDTIRVIVDERQPVALVQQRDGLFRIDQSGVVLEKAAKRVAGDPPFVLVGWDPEQSARTAEINAKRLEIYLSLIEEWKTFGLSERVTAVDLNNTRDVQAVVFDSGQQVTISLGKADFGERLKEGIKVASGNGKKISKVVMDGVSPVIVYRD
ncbi:MAG: FtsQ-type POTRA domain-containing protein [Pyrinomonadaceae bacterium]